MSGLDVAIHPLVAEGLQARPPAGPLAGGYVPTAAIVTARQTLVAAPSASVTPDVVAPAGGRDDHDDEDDLAGPAVSLPLGGVKLGLLGLLRGRAVAGRAADRCLGSLLAVQSAVRRLAADAADVHTHEAVQHVARPPREVEGYHVAAVLEEDVRQVARLLPEARVLALERPFTARRPRTRRDLEALAAVPLHVADQGFGAQVVADKVLGAREEHDGDLLEDAGQQGDGRLRVPRTEMRTYRAAAFGPAGILIRIDVQGGDDVGAAEVGGDAGEVRGPVHAARRVYILQADIIHIVALALAVGIDDRGLLQDVLQDGLTGCLVDVLLLFDGQVLHADAVLGLKPLRGVAALLDQVLLVSELEVRLVLLRW